jgi:SH3-like domain-containing protein
VTAAAATVRAERNNPDSETIANLRRGDQIVLVGEQDGWYRISLADGTEGWVERAAFE